jgi:hypothetical protein
VEVLADKNLRQVRQATLFCLKFPVRLSDWKYRNVLLQRFMITRMTLNVVVPCTRFTYQKYRIKNNSFGLLLNESR